MWNITTPEQDRDDSSLGQDGAKEDSEKSKKWLELSQDFKYEEKR